jgi:transposase-like protein
VIWVTRRTSRAVYKQIIEEGLLRKSKLEAYKHLYHYGPCTSGEIAKALGRNRNNVARTMSLLRDGESVGEADDMVPCPVTGRPVILWDVTGSLPKKTEKRISKKDQELAALREQYAELEEENVYLYKRIAELEAARGE